MEHTPIKGSQVQAPPLTLTSSVTLSKSLTHFTFESHLLACMVGMVLPAESIIASIYMHCQLLKASYVPHTKRSVVSPE